MRWRKERRPPEERAERRRVLRKRTLALLGLYLDDLLAVCGAACLTAAVWLRWGAAAGLAAVGAALIAGSLLVARSGRR